MGAKLNRGASKQDYATPPEFLDAVRKRLKIDTFAVDFAASDGNAVADHYLTEIEDALSQSWINCLHEVQSCCMSSYNVWGYLNPPYNNIRPWAEKCWTESAKGAHIAMLVPASVGSNWWQEFVHHKAHVLMLNDRIQFVGAEWVYPKDLGLLLYTPFIRQGSYEGWSWKT